MLGSLRRRSRRSSRFTRRSRGLLDTSGLGLFILKRVLRAVSTGRGDGAFMEPRGCNGWQSAANRMRAEAAKTVAVGCDRLRAKFHGKEGVESTSCCFGEGYLLLLQSGHGHWSQPQPVHALRIMDRFYSATNLPADGSCRQTRAACARRYLAEFAAAVAAPAFATLFERGGGDDQRCCRIHPPESEQRVRAKTDQERDRQVGAQLRLRRLLDSCRRIQRAANAAFPGGEQRHRRCGEGGEPDSNPAGVGLVAADE